MNDPNKLLAAANRDLAIAEKRRDKAAKRWNAAQAAYDALKDKAETTEAAYAAALAHRDWVASAPGLTTDETETEDVETDVDEDEDAEVGALV